MQLICGQPTSFYYSRINSAPDNATARRIAIAWDFGTKATALMVLAQTNKEQQEQQARSDSAGPSSDKNKNNNQPPRLPKPKKRAILESCNLIHGDLFNGVFHVYVDKLIAYMWKLGRNNGVVKVVDMAGRDGHSWTKWTWDADAVALHFADLKRTKAWLAARQPRRMMRVEGIMRMGEEDQSQGEGKTQGEGSGNGNGSGSRGSGVVIDVGAELGALECRFGELSMQNRHQDDHDESSDDDYPPAMPRSAGAAKGKGKAKEDVKPPVVGLAAATAASAMPVNDLAINKTTPSAAVTATTTYAGLSQSRWARK